MAPTPQATSSSPPGPSGAGSANPANEHSLAVIDWAGNVLRHIDTSTNNTQPKENQMIESTDEELAEDLTPEDICWLLLYALKGSRAAQGLRTGTFHHDTYADTAGYAAVAEIIHLQREGENA